MKVSDIVKAVRFCIDEETVNEALMASAFDFDEQKTDTGMMNNIIINKIPAALRWICLYAPAEQLTAATSPAASGLPDGSSIDIIKEETDKTTTNGLIPLDPAFLRLIRVRGSRWHRAISGDTAIKEDSDEYLQLSDENGAEATIDRPQAAVINTKVKSIEVKPYQSNTFTITYVVTPPVTDLQQAISENGEDTEISIPPMVETSFIYYLAFLLLSAYGDARAQSMLGIANLNIGRTEDAQRL